MTSRYFKLAGSLQNRLPLWGWNRQSFAACINRTVDHHAHQASQQQRVLTTTASCRLCQTSVAFSLLRPWAPIPISSWINPDHAWAQSQHAQGCRSALHHPTTAPCSECSRALVQIGATRCYTKGEQYIHWKGGKCFDVQIVIPKAVPGYQNGKWKKP